MLAIFDHQESRKQAGLIARLDAVSMVAKASHRQKKIAMIYFSIRGPYACFLNRGGGGGGAGDPEIEVVEFKLVAL